MRYLIALSVLFLVYLSQTSARVVVRTINLYDKQAPIGSTVELTCKLTNYYGNRLSWRKVEGRLSDDSEERSGKLIIYNLKKEDSGDYECIVFDDNSKKLGSSHARLTVYNDRESKNSANLNVNVNYEPYVEKEVDENVELFCEFTNEPDLKWKKLNGQMSRYKTEYGAPNNRLLIHYLNEEDSGVYECYLPDGRSSRVKLTVTKPVGEEINVVTQAVDDYQDQFDSTTEVETTTEAEQQPEQETDEPTVQETQAENDQNESTPLENGEFSSTTTNVSTTQEQEVFSETTEEQVESTTSEEEEQNENVVTTNSVIPSTTTSVQSLNDQQYEDDEQPIPTTEQAIEANDFEIQANVTLSQNYLSVLEGDNIENLCTSVINTNGIPTEIEWYNPQKELIQSDFKARIYTEKKSDFLTTTLKSTFKIFGATPSESGRYECLVRFGPKTESASFEIQVEPSRQAFKPCEINEATCRNGQCILKSSLCDGKRDCYDGSDEECDSIVGIDDRCQPNERKCRSGACVQKIWFCDGEKDCEDGSDEESCSAAEPGQLCKSYEHMCSSGNQCVMKGFLCDKTVDCNDNSDEIGCDSPKISLPPIRYLKVIIGSTFRLECRATGFPVPFINWRLNWGHVCEEPRCSILNENGHGTLIVRDARYYDAGAYSCEAINSNGREFAIPDAIVEIINGTTVPTTTTSTTTTTTTTTTVTYTLPPIQWEDSGCNCHNHSNKCTCSGHCYDCEHNTHGRNCHLCLHGFYGDATKGTPYDCLPIGETPTTTTTTPAPCFCHNHSDRCTSDGRCISCEHNTEGRNCEYCKPGFYGDATRGTPFDCYIYTTTASTTTVAPKEFNDCFCHNHAEECTCSGICVQCQHNTEGKYCERCKPGYVGDATRGTQYDCQPDSSLNAPLIKKLVSFTDSNSTKKACNPHGTAQIVDGICRCKSEVIGLNCDQCAPKSFNLMTSRDYKRGCLSCFCNGLEVDCHSSDLFYSKVEADFENEFHSWMISDKFTKQSQRLEFVNEGIEFRNFDDFEDRDLFVIVPEKFKGNKLASYGGNLTLKIKFNDEFQTEAKNFELRLSGSHVNIVFKNSEPLKANTDNEIVIPLYEDSFRRYGDNGKVNREHMLMALVDIKLIMIRAHYSETQTLFRLSEFALDLAQKSEFLQSSRQANSVEVCRCPEGYSGNSCESCAPGYQRSSSGFYLGLCERSYK